MITWRQLTLADLPLLASWLGDPDVHRWWYHDPLEVETDFGPAARGEEPGEDLVVSLDGRPVAFVQRSRIADYAEDMTDFLRVADVPDGAVSVDYLVGSAPDRGRGLGSRIVAAVCADTWTAYPDAPAILVAVVAGNRASWRLLERVGFRRVAEGDIPPENPVDDPLHYVYRLDRPGSPDLR
ncbi:MAG: GNAT family N-acetyltransferase [Jatrophihabitans sp.]|uniref:GNAT family N-acetyltransferase n=1 Tax=Jatrophihabitans sp. TaxID=1932789 RepID=UPI003F7EE226